MRETSSYHFLPLRGPINLSNKSWTSNLKASFLTEVLCGLRDASSVSGQKNKRKAAAYVNGEPVKKRTRSSKTNGTHQTIATDEIPILVHSLEMQYHIDCREDVQVSRILEWSKEEEDLHSILSSLRESHPIDKNINLGDVTFAETRHICMFSNQELLHVPPLLIDGESNDILSPLSADLHIASQMLQSVGRARVEANLAIKIHPDEYSSPKLPFSLFLTLSVFLNIPAIFQPILQPIPHKQSKQTIHALEDAQRRVMRAACLPDEVVADFANDPVTVSTFYSIMRPASPLPSTAAADAMQPDLLQPTLLPFQVRSVAWLLEKEGMSVTTDGSVSPRTSPSSFSFWQEIKNDEHTLYFNRLSGEIRDHEPEQAVVYGGMLAEEPGLGKTVETIALILLNPAPPDWNPNLTRWDSEARLDVKAVKVCSCVI